MNAADFWRFSLRVYGAPRIETICLDLQERHGVNVNLLLLACWLGTCGIRLTPDRFRLLEEAVEAWRADAVLPLRTVRRALKDWLERLHREPPAVHDEAGRLREEVKKSELRAEKIEQRLLVATAADWPEEARGGPELVADNLSIVHDFGGEQTALKALVDAACP